VSLQEWARGSCAEATRKVSDEPPHAEAVRGASGDERVGYTTRPEIRSASYGEPLVGSPCWRSQASTSMLGSSNPVGTSISRT
jgi:hypothetical protein